MALVALGKGDLLGKGVGRGVQTVGGGDGASLVPVSSGRLALELKPRQPGRYQAAWILEVSLWT